MSEIRVQELQAAVAAEREHIIRELVEPLQGALIQLLFTYVYWPRTDKEREIERVAREDLAAVEAKLKQLRFPAH